MTIIQAFEFMILTVFTKKILVLCNLDNIMNSLLFVLGTVAAFNKVKVKSSRWKALVIPESESECAICRRSRTIRFALFSYL